MLALEQLEMRAAAPPAPSEPQTVRRGMMKRPRYSRKRAELRIAGGVGDLAMKGEILVDRGFAALDRGLDRRDSGRRSS